LFYWYKELFPGDKVVTPDTRITTDLHLVTVSVEAWNLTPKTEQGPYWAVGVVQYNSEVIPSVVRFFLLRILRVVFYFLCTEHSRGNKEVPEKEATTRTEDGHK